MKITINAVIFSSSANQSTNRPAGTPATMATRLAFAEERDQNLYRRDKRGEGRVKGEG
jgi:hypothetical protein